MGCGGYGQIAEHGEGAASVAVFSSAGAGGGEEEAGGGEVEDAVDGSDAAGDGLMNAGPVVETGDGGAGGSEEAEDEGGVGGGVQLVAGGECGERVEGYGGGPGANGDVGEDGVEGFVKPVAVEGVAKGRAAEGVDGGGDGLLGLDLSCGGDPALARGEVGRGVFTVGRGVHTYDFSWVGWMPGGGL